MAWTSVGFDGTITEIQWAGLAGLLGNGYVAAGNGDCLVTAVSGARQVSVAAGSLYGDGVLSTNSAPETVAMTTPTNGQWYVIALRRTWATNTAALVAIAGATTTTTTPTVAPTSFPTLNTNVGVLTDQPIAWAWCNSANTTVVVFDIRLKAVKSLPPVVATAAERDAKFMSPTQGLQVWRDDLGAVETYYGLYNSSTNPGGRDTAGWYTNDRQTSRRAMQPSTVTIASGTGSTNSLGVVSFSNATQIELDNVFTSTYTNYQIKINFTSFSTATDVAFRLKSAGTIYTGAQYYGGGQTFRATASNLSYSYNGDTRGYIGGVSSSNDWHVTTIEMFAPQLSKTTSFTFSSVVLNGVVANTIAGGVVGVATQFDGFVILPGSGTMSGTVEVFGIVDK